MFRKIYIFKLSIRKHEAFCYNTVILYPEGTVMHYQFFWLFFFAVLSTVLNRINLCL